ncbi:MAG: choice-of-anchor A family protein [Melioribacteraceae bacterium]|nr:choice-of-anchor A family protein [Melioribacteraceae bacterium]
MTKKNLLQIFILTLFLSSSLFASSNGGTKDLAKSNGGGDKTFGTSTAVITGINPKSTITFTTPITGSYYAGTFNGTVDGNTAKFYCIDVANGVTYNQNYTDEGPTSPAITYILNNYYPYQSYPYAGAAASESLEAAAVQAAIWYFSDIADIQGGTVRTRAQEIIADANLNAGATNPVKTLVFNPVTQTLVSGNAASFVIEAYDESNAPLAGVEVTLSTSDGTLDMYTVTTDVTGTSPVVTLTQGTLDNVSLNATATAVIPQGTRYVHAAQPDNYQKLVLATPTIANVEANAEVNWYEESDLSIVKTVDNENPEDGETISFTITVTNNGPSDATGIEVTEVLPTGLTNLTFSTANGTYDELTSLWNVGTLASGSSAVLAVNASVDYSIFQTTIFDLGPASDYNLFVLKDLVQPSADTEGKIAVGRNATLSNYSVADKLPNSNGTEDVLVVGRKLTYTSGAVFAGNVVYGRFQDVAIPAVSIDNGTLRQEQNVIDFAAAGAYLRNLSNQLKGQTANGTTEFKWGGLYLTGTDPFLNVFSVNGDELSAANNVDISVPNGSVVLVNISKKNVTWSGGLIVHGTDISNVLYNFYQATALSIQGINVTGSILAPKASVDFVSGVQNGQMIAKNVSGPGQFNHVPFIGNLPIDEVIVNAVEVTAVDQPDPDSEPANGLDEEDDYADVNIYLSNVGANNGGGDNEGGNNGGSTFDGNWEYVSGFGAYEIVWAMATDNSGNLLSGTWGGIVYRSEDGGVTWTRINDDMHVGYIWDIAVDDNDDIYIATEQGVFYSKNDGSTWIQSLLTGKDVRSLTISGGKVFAATWGFGVYRSNGRNAAWTAMNNGLNFPAVHALTSTSNGDLFAGTFGGGIYKSVDNGANWTQSDNGYAHIWTLGVDNNDNVYAGTYGSGVYVSEDAGDSWAVANLGLNGMYIYSITFDASNDVYVSSWSNGVFKLNNNAKSTAWNSLGLEALKVSSVYASPKSNTVFAGTSDGAILKYSDNSITSVEEISNPEEFRLEQNYPNPFNPTTNIKFNIAVDGKYKIAIYNIIGQEVALIANQDFASGAHEFNFDATGLSSGIYIYRLSGASVNLTKKMILMK